MNTNEKELIIELIFKNKDLIYKICTMYSNNTEDNDDLFQEICIQLWKSYPGFRNNSKISTWIYRVALNTAISWVRKENRHYGFKTTFENTKFIGDEFPFYIEEEKKEQIQCLYKAINSLSKHDRTLVLLYLEEVSNFEIAEILGISEVNIRVKMNRIRKQLKTLLSHEAIR
jgi:RNA polymerase sigma-70 factor, ECF subfamily